MHTLAASCGRMQVTTGAESSPHWSGGAPTGTRVDLLLHAQAAINKCGGGADDDQPVSVSSLVPRRVYRQHERPHFPPGTWTKYQCLAESCWSADPDSRPQFDEIIQQLQQLLDAAGGPFTCASPFVPDADIPGSTVR
jgi:hypothetical protein